MKMKIELYYMKIFLCPKDLEKRLIDIYPSSLKLNNHNQSNFKENYNKSY